MYHDGIIFQIHIFEKQTNTFSLRKAYESAAVFKPSFWHQKICVTLKLFFETSIAAYDIMSGSSDFYKVWWNFLLPKTLKITTTHLHRSLIHWWLLEVCLCNLSVYCPDKCLRNYLIVQTIHPRPFCLFHEFVIKQTSVNVKIIY